MAKQFTLGKKERLKSRKLIDQLFKEGKSFSVPPFRTFYQVSIMSDQPLLFGIAVGNKNFKRAVDRNRIKRLVRESYRLQKLELQEKLAERSLQLNVFFVYTGKAIPEYKQVYEVTGTILERLSKIVLTEK